ncbi:MAG: NgoFVII restriction endonuclease domain protein [Frankiales bacterium]|nr:NgoFVII restriction endonuclease domain protein [Frankiales bacterium]
MKVEFVGQLAGADTAAATIETYLCTGDFTRLRFMIAFTRWSGLNLLDAALQTFAATPGTSIDGVCGVDLGGTTAEALTYLKELPGANIKIFRSGNPRVVFHPKIFLLDGPNRWVAIVGSSNLTSGGLHTNAEASLVVDGVVGKDLNPVADYWDDIWGCKPPLNASHIEILDDTLLASLAPRLESYKKPPPDSGRAGKGIPALGLSSPLPPIGRPPIPARRAPSKVGAARKRAPGTLVAVPTGPGVLYMELHSETGGGTQVQMSKAAFTGFFGASPGTTTYVDLKTPMGRDRVRLQYFGNFTYRIPLAFVRNTSRPAVLRFERTGPDEYQVDVVENGQRGYAKWLRMCNTRHRAGSKAYGIY